MLRLAHRAWSPVVLVGAGVAAWLCGAVAGCGGRVGPDPYELNEPATGFDGGSSGTSSGSGAPGTASVMTGNPLTAGTGTVDAFISAPGVTTAYSLTYTLTNASGVVRTATLANLEGQSISVTLSNVPAGLDYLLTVDVNTNDDTVGCVGSHALTVDAGAAVTVNVTATCSQGLPSQVVQDAGVSPPAEASAPPVTGYGTLAATVKIPDGVDLPDLSLVLLGATGVITQNTIAVAGVSSPSFQYRDIPSGTGFTLDVQGTTEDGTELCSSSSMFAIVPDQTTNATIFLTCAAAH